ncbi:MAG TPA: tRNA pseudouridine(55) synthase TruB [Pyrinomonadaceae bacterium]|jgi:tRNA pseudouridine55 synthase|nr:tRNA pseudouridine(55) synthase TruB [Pyrinomonadaceae bacterium]
MDGLLVIDKPEGITSHDVVARVRRVLKTKRVGHTGTLDPFATGVLVLLLGKATRLAQFLDKDTKEYIATVKFGFETDTGDKTGVRSAECGLRNEELARLLKKTDWDLILSQFKGEIEQTPPMYSAKKIEGKKLYELARKGIEIERQPVRINVYEIAILANEIHNPQSTIRIRVACSAGTYIRTLAEDIGRRLGIGAHLTELRRTAAGAFRIDEAVTLESLQTLDDPTVALRPIDEATSSLRMFELSDERVEKTKSGMSTRDLSGLFADGESVQMIDQNGELIAIGRFNETEKAIQPKIVLV